MYIVYCTILSCKGSRCTLYIVQYCPVKDRDVHIVYCTILSCKGSICILYIVQYCPVKERDVHIVYCTILSKQIIYYLFFTFYILHLQICIVIQFLLNCKNPINGFDQIDISTTEYLHQTLICLSLYFETYFKVWLCDLVKLL